MSLNRHDFRDGGSPRRSRHRKCIRGGGGSARLELLKIICLVMPLLAVVPIAHAEESPTDSTGDARAPFNSDETQPVLSSDSLWAVSLLAAFAGLFLAAAVIGPIVRAEAPDAVPAAMSHEEDPAADQH